MTIKIQHEYINLKTYTTHTLGGRPKVQGRLNQQGKEEAKMQPAGLAGRTEAIHTLSRERQADGQAPELAGSSREASETLPAS